MVQLWSGLLVSVSVLIIGLAAWFHVSRPSINAEGELTLAIDAAANQRFDEAEQRFFSIIALGGPARVVERARQNLGFLYLDTKRGQLAESVFETALATNPGNEENQFNLAETYLEQRKPKAKLLFLKCVEAHPSFHPCLDGLARFLLTAIRAEPAGDTAGRISEMKRVLRELVRHAPEGHYAESLHLFFSLVLTRVPRKTSDDPPPSSTVIHVDPPIFKSDGFFTAEECAHVISLGANDMPRSTIHQQSADAVRTSSSLKLHAWAADKFLSTLPSKLSVLTGIASEILQHGLNVQLVRYRPGEQFSLHLDCSPWHHDPQYRRPITLFIYLNTLPQDQGGRTAFPFAHLDRSVRVRKIMESADYLEASLVQACVDKTRVSVQPEQGSSILWYNYNKNQDADALTYHIGCPVRDGSGVGKVKWGLNVWFTLTPTVVDLLLNDFDVDSFRL